MAAILAALALSVTAATADPIRIVAFGTSLTARVQWQGALAKQLANCRAVEIVTLAKSGMNSSWAVETLPQVAAARPSIVLVEFAVNDASLLHGVSREGSRANIEALLDGIEAAGARPVLMTMNPAHGARLLSRPWLADYYQLYRDLAAERGVMLVDLTPIWDARGDLATSIPDGIHPTGEAVREVIVPALAEALRPLLCP